MTVIDACAGAGGWEALSGVDALGIELDSSACAIREAAGLRTLQADIAALSPLDFAPCEGWIGSMPCPTFSSAGRGSGRDLESVIRAAIKDLAEGRDTRAERRAEAYMVLEPDTAMFDVLPSPRRRRKREQRAVSPVDRARIARREAKRELARREAATSLLVVEPLRWALALRPRWIALEQVPPVLPLWEAMAAVLRGRGYSCWAGICSSERYGVPQTRRRAILIASLDRVVSMPPPTHQRYIAPRKRAAEAGADALFAVPEPERIVAPEDRHLLLWVSMAEALGWHGGAYRLARGAGMCERHGDRPDTPMSEPAPAITTKARTASWVRPTEEADDGRGTAGRDVPALLRGDLPAAEVRRDDAGQHAGSGPLPDMRDDGGSNGGPAGEGARRDDRGRREASLAGEDNHSDFGGEADAGAPGRLLRAANAVRFRAANDRPNAAERETSEPAPTLAFGHNPPRWVLRSGQSVAGEGRAERSTKDPSLTVISRFDLCEWVPEGQARNSGPGAEREPRPIDAPSYTIRAAGSGSHPSGVEWVRTNNSTKGGTRDGLARPVDEPARTVDGQASQWTVKRPSTTVDCDPRIAEPGRHEPGESGSQYGPETVRVSVAEASALQSFPPDWPWHAAGTKTAAFRAVGNAVPALLALHVLLAVVGPELAASLQERLAALTNRKDAA